MAGKLYDGSRMLVAGLMSRSGSNLEKIIEHEHELEEGRGRSPYHVQVIFTDNPDSNAREIARKFGLHCVVNDIVAFYKGETFSDMAVRAEFDERVVAALKHFDVSCAVFAGYMSIASPVLVDAFLGVNVHPADLRIMEDGRRKYVGARAVADAINAGEEYLRSTTHIVEAVVDYGRILMVSAPLPVDLSISAGSNQERLKTVGDWTIFPKTIEYIADGRYAQDESGLLYFDGRPIPEGLVLEKH